MEPRTAHLGAADYPPSHRPRVLVVDDDEATRTLLRRALSGRGFTVSVAATGAAALQVVAGDRIDVVLLDSLLPDLPGEEVLARLRAGPATATLPVILLSGKGHPADRIGGLEAGADDYLVKPVDLNELVARIRAQVRGRDAWRTQVADALHQRAALAGAIAGISPDLSVTDATAELVDHLLTLDAVHGVAVYEIHADHSASLLGGRHLELPGVAVGDTLPPSLVAELRQTMVHSPDQRLPQTSHLPRERVQALLPQLNGDIVVAPLGSRAAPWGTLLLEIAGPLGADTEHLRHVGSTVTDLLPVVERVLGPVLSQRVDHSATAGVIAAVIEQRAFRPHYQPIVDLGTSRPVGYEALTRFTDQTRPDVRFAEAAHVGLGIELEQATLHAALVESQRLPADAYLTVNVSAQLLVGGHLQGLLGHAPGRAVVLEITEHEQIHDYDAVRAALDALGPHVRMSVDDAGSGWASLRHVFTLRPDFVKVDRGWVSAIDTDPARQALLLGIAQFVGLMGGTVIAEGVERPAELACLQDLGIGYAQGYLLGPPSQVENLGG